MQTSIDVFFLDDDDDNFRVKYSWIRIYTDTLYTMKAVTIIRSF